MNVFNIIRIIYYRIFVILTISVGIVNLTIFENFFYFRIQYIEIYQNNAPFNWDDPFTFSYKEGFPFLEFFRKIFFQIFFIFIFTRTSLLVILGYI